MDLNSIAQVVISVLGKMGYLGIIGVMALESMSFPLIIPGEVFIITYGAMAKNGNFNIILVLLFSILGVWIGSIINYYLAMFFGRAVFLKYGKYVGLKKSKIEYFESVFLKYGKYVVFVGRFLPLPGLKHVIAIPAGFSKMNIKLFSIATILGACVFSFTFGLIGYFVKMEKGTLKKIISVFEELSYLTITILLMFFIVRFLIKKIKK